MRTQGEGSQLQAKERDLRRHQTCQYLDRGLLACSALLPLGLSQLIQSYGDPVDVCLSHDFFAYSSLSFPSVPTWVL